MNLSKCLENETNYTETHNGAVAYKSTLNSVVDLFAQIGAMRNRNAKDKIMLFENAFAEDKELSMKILFYIRDCRGGQGERQTFRDIYTHLTNLAPEIAIANIDNIVEFGRYDDLVYIAYNSTNKKFVDAVITYIQIALNLDMKFDKNPTLLAKWLPSINTSNHITVKQAKWLADKLKISHKEYRKTLSTLRKRINIIENNLREKKYDKINYSNVPSLAMNKYRSAFYRNDEERFSDYIDEVKSGKQQIKAQTLYPYDVVRAYLSEYSINDVLEQQWKALPDYLNGAECKSLVVSDVSGSMMGLPMYVSISLALYISERLNGEFKNKFITFSEKPNFVTLKENESLYNKIKKIYNADWGYNTDIKKVFELILNVAKKYELQQKDLPENIIVVTDMNFDVGSGHHCSNKTLFDVIKKEFKKSGYKLPKLIWWNVNAVNEAFPMKADENCQYVSGASPSIMKAILNGQMLSPIDLIKSAVLIERYKNIKF